VLGGLIALQVFQSARYKRQTEAFPNDSIVGAGRPVLLEIGAASCIYCRRMMPVLTELAADESIGFAVALVSLDTQPEAREKYGVQAIPMQIFYDGQGRELDRHTGMLTREQIFERWRRLEIDPQPSS